MSCSSRMLAVSGRTVARQCSRRAQSTLSDAQASESIAQSTTSALRGAVAERNRRTVFIRPWDGINSIPEALAVLRGVENHFGKVLDFQVLRDVDRTDIFLPYMRAEFKHAVKIPSTSVVIKVKVPLYDRAQSGGPGLLDIRDYLETRDNTVTETSPWDTSIPSTDPTVEEEEGFKIVDVKVEATKIPILYRRINEYTNMGADARLKFGKAFAEWGGFAPVHKPIPNDQHIPQSDEAPPSRMATAQTFWDTQFKKAGVQAKTVSPAAETIADAGSDASEDSPVAEFESLDVSVIESDLSALPSDESIPDTNATPTSTPAPFVPLGPASTKAAPTRPPPGMTKRQKILQQQRLLAQARELAQKSLPEKYTDTAEQKAQKQKEKEEEEATKASLMGRLWKFFGGHQ